PSSVRNPYLTFLSSRIQRHFKPFGALAALFRGASDAADWAVPPERRAEELIKHALRLPRNKADDFIKNRGDPAEPSFQAPPRGPDLAFQTRLKTRLGAGSRLLKKAVVLWLFTACAPSSFVSLGYAENEMSIHEIQGSGSRSPFVGATDIVVHAVVVGDFQGIGRLGGFCLQEEDRDADTDPKTSEAIFVYHGDSAVEVEIGDFVTVRGDVDEYYGLTELNNLSALTLHGRVGIPSPTAIELPISDLDEWEKYEAMLVELPQKLTVTDVSNLGRFGEVLLSIAGRQFSPTSRAAPGASAIALREANEHARILLDDGSNAVDPRVTPFIAVDDTVRIGDTLFKPRGVLLFAHDNFRLHPIEPLAFSRPSQRAPSPPEVGASLVVASFNLDNFFNGDGQKTGFPTTRGARTLEEFSRQLDKVISALARLNADIAALTEIENDGYSPQSCIQRLVKELSSRNDDGYAFIDPGVERIGEDLITVGIIYKPDSVVPVGRPAILDSRVDPIFDDRLNRPSLAQTFEQIHTGEQMTVVVNHFKSKSSRCDQQGDPDTGDGQGNCNVARTKAAQALVNWLNSDPTESRDPDFLIVGDLNAYAMEDPINIAKSAGYIDLIKTCIGEDAYSYVYQGQSGYLDHALATGVLAQQVTTVAVWHINADESPTLDYRMDNPEGLFKPDPFRSSDHDPVLIGFDLRSGGEESVTRETGCRTQQACREQDNAARQPSVDPSNAVATGTRSQGGPQRQRETTSQTTTRGRLGTCGCVAPGGGVDSSYRPILFLLFFLRRASEKKRAKR
ncbi:MAG: ExeM/NucH family extracellular endonuclease, partial [Deltaproteobacteria bacterium]|nr:ExeM/NucH family extracellular endonuclease [Deltaproteobacteria bacterium]